MMGVRQQSSAPLWHTAPTQNDHARATHNGGVLSAPLAQRPKRLHVSVLPSDVHRSTYQCINAWAHQGNTVSVMRQHRNVSVAPCLNASGSQRLQVSTYRCPSAPTRQRRNGRTSMAQCISAWAPTTPQPSVPQCLNAATPTLTKFRAVPMYQWVRAPTPQCCSPNASMHQCTSAPVAQCADASM